MTDSEKLLAYYLMLAIKTLKGEYPEDQWDEYHIQEMEDAIALVAMGGMKNETAHGSGYHSGVHRFVGGRHGGIFGWMWGDVYRRERTTTCQ